MLHNSANRNLTPESTQVPVKDWKVLANQFVTTLLDDNVDKDFLEFLSKQPGCLHPDNIKTAITTCKSTEQLAKLLLTGLENLEYNSSSYILTHHIANYGSKETKDALLNLLLLLTESNPKETAVILGAQEVVCTVYSFTGEMTLFGSTIGHCLIDSPELVEKYLAILFKLKEKLDKKLFIQLLGKRTLGGRRVGDRLLFTENEKIINKYISMLVPLLATDYKTDIIKFVKLDTRDNTLSNDSSKELKNICYHLNQYGFTSESAGLNALTHYFSGNKLDNKILQDCHHYLMNEKHTSYFKPDELISLLLDSSRNNITLCHFFAEQLDVDAIKQLFAALLSHKAQAIDIISKLIRKNGQAPALSDIILRRKNDELIRQYISFSSVIQQTTPSNELYNLLKNATTLLAATEMATMICDHLTSEILSKEACQFYAGYKNEITQYLLRLPENDSKIALLSNALNKNHPLGQIFWYQRGIKQPSLKSGNLKLINACLTQLQVKLSPKKLQDTTMEPASQEKQTNANETVPDSVWAHQYPNLYKLKHPAEEQILQNQADPCLDITRFPCLFRPSAPVEQTIRPELQLSDNEFEQMMQKRLEKLSKPLSGTQTQHIKQGEIINKEKTSQSTQTRVAQLN